MYMNRILTLCVLIACGMARGANWTISPSTKTVSNLGGTFTLSMNTGDQIFTDFSASCSTNWLKVNHESFIDFKSGSLTVSVDANDEMIYSRRGSIDINGWNGPAHSYQYLVGRRSCTVLQRGSGAAVSPSSVSYAWNGERQSVDMVVANKAKWKLVPRDSWISISSGSGIGSASVQIGVEENMTGSDRTSYIDIFEDADDPSRQTGDDNTEWYWIPVRQTAKPLVTANPVITPASGTIFGSSLSVNISCETEGATIYYTTNGSEPTTESAVYDRFKIYGKTTIKAMAVKDGLPRSEIVVSEYAKGRCADPVIFPEHGSVFYQSGQQVTIGWDDSVGELHYTTDGTEPTIDSATYFGPFAINDSTIVRAKVFDDEYFDSAIVTAYLERHWDKVATPTIESSDTFSGTRHVVSIACATDGAVIRYTTDGSEPNSHSAKYTGAFEITATTTVKAIATKTDFENSEIASRMITKIWCIGDALNMPDQSFSTDASLGWTRDISVSYDGVESMRSGAIGNSSAYGLYNESMLSAVLTGKGVISFRWRTDCESDDEFEWDHAEFRVDGVVVAKLNGDSGWQEKVHEITTSGEHTISWVYLKDDFGGRGLDCAWVDMVSWIPELSPLPELPLNPTAQDVLNALDGSADANLLERITDPVEYCAFREWANAVKSSTGTSAAGPQAVKDCAYAWLSFALKTDRLISRGPVDGDLEVESFVINESPDLFDFTIGIKDIEVGPAQEKHLSEVFSIEGSFSPDGVYSASSVNLHFEPPSGGKVKVKAGPKASNQSKFFMKARMCW